MKKFQIGTLALAAFLAIGGGAVFASEKADGATIETVVKKEASTVVTVDGMETEIYSTDEALLKAIDNGEVEIMIDSTESVPAQEVDGMKIESDDEAFLKAIENGEIEIIGATESVPAQKAE